MLLVTLLTLLLTLTVPLPSEKKAQRQLLSTGNMHLLRAAGAVIQGGQEKQGTEQETLFSLK